MKTQPIFSASILALLCAGATATALNIDTVPIGDFGNPSDGTGYGGVATTYAVGKYEVTLNQYSEFLNSVADTDDYGLYNPNMETDLNIKGITRSGSSGSYTYMVNGDGQRPVTYVSWFDAARFTNWLHNGQPNTGSQTAGTTEDGAYTLLGATSVTSFSKNGLAQYWIPSENEWYKAAYYQPAAAGGDTDGYWLYPTRSNSEPGNTIGGMANQGNFNDGFVFSVTQSGNHSVSQNYLTAGGAYTASASFYGTFDQGGNVFEWNESRGVRGAAWGYGKEDLRASNRYSDQDPSHESGTIGFRVGTVPEPTVAISLILAGGLLLARRKRPSVL